LRVQVVYTSVEKIQFSPPKGRWLALRTRAIAIWGDGLRHTLPPPRKDGTEVVQFPLLSNRSETQATVSELAYRIKTVSLLGVLIGKRMSAERKQTPQVVESLRNR
jgi:hypothetical protein